MSSDRTIDASETIAPNLVDARPRLPAEADSLWDKATVQRDRIAGLLDRLFQSMGLIVWVRKSKPGEYPLYVLIDNWQPSSTHKDIEATERSSLKIIIEVEPYREIPLTYSVELRRQTKHWQASYWSLSDKELKELAAYLVRGGSKPSFFKSRTPALALIFGAFFPPIIWMTTPRNRLVSLARPKWLTIPSVLGWGGLLAAGGFGFAAYQQQQLYEAYYDPEIAQAASAYLMCALLGVAALVTGIVVAAQRPRLFAVPKQSFRTPRHEIMVDSWHVSVPEAGVDFATFVSRLAHAVASLDSSIVLNKEVHQQLSPRGFEERERYVLTKGQANAHVHIYPFGRDAFVGWDGYLNFAKWTETDPVSTTIQDGKRVEFRSLAAGVHVPSEFDLIELNALTELVHRALVREIKAFLKEREIEADLDFKIIRGDRDRALKAGNERDDAKEHQKNASRRYFASE